MQSRYPRAVGKQPPQGPLGASFLDWFDNFKMPAPLKRTPATNNFWNAGVNMAYGREAAYPMKTYARAAHARMKTRVPSRPSADVGVEAYNRAKTLMDYGNLGGAHEELGGLFDDIMGAVVPGWDSRPDWMKQIDIKPDASKMIAMAQKIAPNAGEKIVKAANAAGLGVYVTTPAGQVEVTPQNAQNLYGMYPFVTKAQSFIGGLSPMVWLAVGGVGLGLFLMMKR